MDGDRRSRRLLAALVEATRAHREDEAVRVTLKLLRLWQRRDQFTATRDAAELHAMVLLKRTPRNSAVRRFWGLGAPGRALVPLLDAQVLMFSPDERSASTQCVSSGRAPPRAPPRAPHTIFGLVASHLAYIADLRALACVSRDARLAMELSDRHRVRRATPLCWCDVVAAHRYGLRVLLPGGGTLSAERTKDEASTCAVFVDEHTDVFECMLRAYAAGRSGRELVVGAVDARCVRDAAGGPSPWIAAFGCALGAADHTTCRRLLAHSPNTRLGHEARRAVWAKFSVSIGGGCASHIFR